MMNYTNPRNGMEKLDGTATLTRVASVTANIDATRQRTAKAGHSKARSVGMIRTQIKRWINLTLAKGNLRYLKP